MACGSGCGCADCGGANGGCGPGPCPPNRALAYTTASAECYASSLGRRLIGTADRLRNLETKFGMRPYIVRLVRTQWSGGVRGQGEESVIPEPEQLLPTPLLLDMKTLNRVVSPIGIDENGGVMLTEVSGCYTEEHLVGRDDDGTAIPADQSFYYEVEFLRADGRPSEKRRFFPSGAPEYGADEFGWSVKLERQRWDRDRDGYPR